MTTASLFVHSSGTNPLLWKQVPEAVVAGSLKLAPANLGIPPNPLLPRGTIVTAAMDAAHVLSSIPPDVDRVHLFAHSYGGVVALKVAEALGPRLASLFLVEPVLFRWLRHQDDAAPEALADLQLLIDHPWFGTAERGGTEEWLDVFIDYWNGPGAFRAMPEPMRRSLIALGWKIFQEVTTVVNEEVTPAPFLRDVPTTLVLGEKTTAAARGVVLALSRWNPKATVIELPDAGHMAVLTEAPRVHREMLAHVDRVRR